MPSVSGVDLVSGALRSTLKLAQRSYNLLNSKQQSRKAKRKERKQQRKLQRQYGNRLPQSSTSAGLASSSTTTTPIKNKNRYNNNHHQPNHTNNHHKIFKKNSYSKHTSKFNSFNGSKTKLLHSSSKVNSSPQKTSNGENPTTTATQLDSSFSRNSNNQQQESDEESENGGYYENSTDTTELLEFDSSGPQKSPFTLSLRAKYLCLNSKNSVESTTTANPTITTTTSTKENGFLDNKKTSKNNIQNEQSASSGLKSKSPVLARMNGNSNNINGGTIGVPRLAEPKHVLYKRDNVQPGWKQKMPVGSGLINFGNSCYLNATLQALLHTPAFINWLMTDEEHKKKCRNNSQFIQQCTICAMSHTMFDAFRTNQPIRPIQIYNKLKIICKHFQHGRQEDAHEFLRYLLESMERSYLNAINGQKLDNRSKETTPLSQIFGGYIRTEVTCLKCQHVSTTFQPLAELQLDIRHVSTLEDAVQNHFKKERLENNDYKCEKCHANCQATKQFSLEIPPIVLCLQLKRFTLFGTKINKPIHCNRTLNLRRYIHKSHTDGNDVDAVYRLVGLVTHIGSSPNCGHYTAIAEAQNGQFYQFDDSYVRQTSMNAAQNSDAYVIIYEIDRSKQNQSPSVCNRPSNSNTSNNFVSNKNVHNSSISLPPTSKPSSSISSCTSTSSISTASSTKLSSPPKSISPRPEPKINGINGIDNHSKITVNGNSSSLLSQKIKPKTNGEVLHTSQQHAPPKLQNLSIPNDDVRLKLKRPNGDIDPSEGKVKKPNTDNDSTNDFKPKKPNNLATTPLKLGVSSAAGEANSKTIPTIKRANSEEGKAQLKIKNGSGKHLNIGQFTLVPYDDEDEEVNKDGDKKSSCSDDSQPKKNPSKLVKPSFPTTIFNSSNNNHKQFPNPWKPSTLYSPPRIKNWNEDKSSVLDTYVHSERKRAFDKTKEELEDEEIDAGRIKKKPKDVGQKDPTKSQVSFDNFAVARARNM